MRVCQTTRRLPAALLCMVVVLNVAWNTREDPAPGEPFRGPFPNEELWKKVYLGTSATNEHTAIGIEALTALGAGVLAQEHVDAGALVRITDLNASMLTARAGLRPSYGDVGATPLEERALPSPPHFAGLPDYSWALHDWINKGAFCPVQPSPMDAAYLAIADEVDYDLCHHFKGVMGALNSNHFGVQAKVTYEHLHRIALDRAYQASWLRERLSSDPVATGEWHSAVLETELEALVFESVAQHFLQDRWCICHMWNRWNAADYDDLPVQNLALNGLVAGVSGLIHGAESIVGVPLPMCSPTQDADGTVYPMIFDGTMRAHGVGDMRLSDLINGEYRGRAIDV